MQRTAGGTESGRVPKSVPTPLLTSFIENNLLSAHRQRRRGPQLVYGVGPELVGLPAGKSMQN